VIPYGALIPIVVSAILHLLYLLFFTYTLRPLILASASCGMLAYVSALLVLIVPTHGAMAIVS